MGFYRRDGYGMWAVELKPERKFIGRFGIQWLEELEEIEIGWMLHKKYWGRGLATEAARASLEYGFDQCGLDRIIAIAEPENLASIRIMQKLGMSFVKKLTWRKQKVVYYEIMKELK